LLISASAWQGGVVFGQIGVLISLIVLTIVLAGVFLVRPSFTAGATGKILAFVGLCILPTLCVATGMSFHMQRSQQTAYCVSCHSMETHGESLHLLDASFIPAQHFENHLVPPNQACYTCHTDYTMYGPLKDKLKGLRYLYMEYVSTPPKTIHLDGKYSNLQCLHCHAGMRSFDENPTHTAIMGPLKTNQISCISCHDMIHNASEVGQLKMWVDGKMPALPATVLSSAAPARPEAAATARTSKAPSRSSAGSATTAQGKSVFDSQHCSGCHGDGGVGGSGPALTHTASQYPPAQLMTVLKAPTAQMKAAGMVPLTVNAADMKALVSYVSSIGGAPIAPAAKPSDAGSSASVIPKAEPSATAAPSKAPVGKPPFNPVNVRGKGIFNSQGCSGCHGETGGGGTGPALAHLSSHYSAIQVAAVQKGITAILYAPTAKMKAGGMVPLSLNGADMEALVSYVSSVGQASVAPAAASSAPGSSKSAAGSPTGNATTAQGKSIFDSQHCNGCHGEAGVGGSGPALTHTSSQYPPAQLTAVLKAPTAQMKAAGMVPLTVSDADMKALVAYVSSLGGPSTGSAATAPSAGSAEAASSSK
jgi:cytochrome c-type protein NapC